MNYNKINDIICFETLEEQGFSDWLSEYIIDAIKSENQEMIGFIRGLWNNENWFSIINKFSTEGSTWYVWWMDGVREFSRVYTNCP